MRVDLKAVSQARVGVIDRVAEATGIFSPVVFTWLRTGGFAVLDQALFSGANFVASIMLARWLIPADYGAFAVAQSVLLLFAAFHTALITEPMLVYGAGRYARQFRGYLSVLTRAHCGLTAIFATLLLLAAVALSPWVSRPIGFTLVGLSAACPLVLLLWLIRRAFYVRGEPKFSALGGALYLALMVAGLYAVNAAGWLSPATALAVMGVGSLVASVWLFSRLRADATLEVPPTPATVAHDHWRYGKWALGTAVATWLSGNIFYLLLPLWAGLEGSGALRAVINLTLPIHQCNAAIAVLLPSFFVRALKSGGIPRFTRYIQLALFCFLASALGYFAALLLFGHELSLWLYRGQYTDHSHLLFWAGLLPVTGAISTVLGSALRSLERPDRVFWCNAAATLVTVTVGVWLLATQGLDGVILGAFIASATGAVVIVVVYTRTFASFRRDSAGAGIVDSPKLAVAHLAGAALVPLPFGLTENTFAEPTAIDSETRRPAQRSTANFMWAAFAERLDRAGIRYCVLHGWQTLPDSLPSDLDLIVERRDLAKFESLLHEEPDWQPVQVIQYEHSGYYFVLAHRRHGGHVLIDAAFDYRRNGRILFTADELLAGRTRWGAFWVAAPRVEFIYLLTKKILKGNIPEAQKGRLRELAAVLGDAAQSAVQRLLGPEWEDDLLCWLKQGDWANFAAKLPELKHAVTRQSARRFRFNGLRYRLAELARGWRRVRYPTGFMVVVLGPDGAGKSTLNEGLSRDLSGVFRRSQGYHLRPGLLGRKKDTGPVTNPHGKPVYSPWLSMLKVAFYSLDCCAGYWLKLRPKLIQSALVHFDRYYEDLLVDPRRYCYAGPAGFVRFARRWVPQPDLFLILDVLQERLLARKQEVTPEEVGRQQRAYVELARRLPNAVLIDGSQSPEVVIRQAKAVILERLHERYRARRPLWFAPEEDEAVAWARSVLRAGAPENGAGTGVSVAGEGGRTNANERIFNSIKLRDGREYWIPTGSSRQRSAALELYRPNTVKGRLAKSVAALALKAGFIENFAPSTALVERGGASGASLFDHIERILCQTNLTFAIYLGTPGPQRKPVIQAIDPTGRPIAYVKVGWDEFTSRLVENENRVIELLNGCGFRHGQLPRVLHFARWNERTLLVTEPMQLQSFGNARQLADDLILKFLLEVAAGPQDRAVFSRSALFNSLKTRLSELKKTLTPHKHQPLQSAIELLETSLGSVALPWFWRLGDFTPWNLGIDYTGAKVQVIDLEYAGGAALPGWDLFHFWAQTNFARAHGRRRDAFAAYFRAVEVDERFVPLLDLCYRLDLFTERAKAWEESGQRRSARAVGDFNDGLRSIQELTHRIRTGGAYVHRVI